MAEQGSQEEQKSNLVPQRNVQNMLASARSPFQRESERRQRLFSLMNRYRPSPIRQTPFRPGLQRLQLARNNAIDTPVPRAPERAR